MAFCFIAANTEPDHNSISTFHRRFVPQIEALFVQVLVLTREMKCLNLDNIALDGTKIAANASKPELPVFCADHSERKKESSCSRVLESGVDLYEIRPERTRPSKRLGLFGSSLGRLHAKTAIVDGQTVFIGSMNLDPRSDIRPA